MNANAIWAGNHYAHSYSRGRGQNFVWNANRLRVIKVYKTGLSQYGRERATTMVRAQMLNADGTPQRETRYNYDTRKYEDVGIKVVEVRARDIFAHWDEYQAEVKRRQNEQARIEAERQQAEKDEEHKKERILESLEKLGVPRNLVSSIGVSTIYITRRDYEDFFSLNTPQAELIEAANPQEFPVKGIDEPYDDESEDVYV